MGVDEGGVTIAHPHLTRGILEVQPGRRHAHEALSVDAQSNHQLPGPRRAVVFARGGVRKYTWLVGAAAGLGETIGALTIYMTGHGAG